MYLPLLKPVERITLLTKFVAYTLLVAASQKVCSISVVAGKVRESLQSLVIEDNLWSRFWSIMEDNKYSRECI